MSDFVMLAAALAAVTVTFAVPLGFMISAALRAGWRIGLMSAATLALVWFALRFLLFGLAGSKFKPR